MANDGNRVDSPSIPSPSGVDSHDLLDALYWWEIEEIMNNSSQECRQDGVDFTPKFPPNSNNYSDDNTENVVKENVLNVNKKDSYVSIPSSDEIHIEDTSGENLLDTTNDIIHVITTTPESDSDKDLTFIDREKNTDDEKILQDEQIEGVFVDNTNRRKEDSALTIVDLSPDNTIHLPCIKEAEKTKEIPEDEKQQFLALLDLTEGKDFWPALGVFNKKYPMPVPENALLAIEQERKNNRRVNTYTEKTPTEVHLEYLDVVNIINSGKNFWPIVSNFLQNFRVPDPKPASSVPNEFQTGVAKADVIIGQKDICVDKSLLDNSHNTTVPISENTSADSKKEVPFNNCKKSQLELHLEFLSLIDIIDSSKDCWPAVANFIKQFPISKSKQITAVPGKSRSYPETTASDQVLNKFQSHNEATECDQNVKEFQSHTETMALTQVPTKFCSHIENSGSVQISEEFQSEASEWSQYPTKSQSHIETTGLVQVSEEFRTNIQATEWGQHPTESQSHIETTEWGQYQTESQSHIETIEWNQDPTESQSHIENSGSVQISEKFQSDVEASEWSEYQTKSQSHIETTGLVQISEEFQSDVEASEWSQYPTKSQSHIETSGLVQVSEEFRTNIQATEWGQNPTESQLHIETIEWDQDPTEFQSHIENSGSVQISEEFQSDVEASEWSQYPTKSQSHIETTEWDQDPKRFQSHAETIEWDQDSTESQSHIETTGSVQVSEEFQSDIEAPKWAQKPTESQSYAETTEWGQYPTESQSHIETTGLVQVSEEFRSDIEAPEWDQNPKESQSHAEPSASLQVLEEWQLDGGKDNMCSAECRCPIPEEHNFIVKFRLMETPDVDLSNYTIEQVIAALEKVLK